MVVPTIKLKKDKQDSTGSFTVISSDDRTSPREDREKSISPKQSDASCSTVTEEEEDFEVVEEKDDKKKEETIGATTSAPSTSTNSQSMLSVAAMAAPAVTTTSLVVSSSTPKTIEIFIPSYPELGIKETRTDRIDLPQEIMTPKPFVIYSNYEKNYVLENGQYHSVYPTTTPTIGSKNPDPGGQQQQEQSPLKSNQQQQQQQKQQSNYQSNSNLKTIPTSEPSSQRSVPISTEVTTENRPDSPAVAESVKSIPSPQDNDKEWYIKRQHMHEHFTELRSKAFKTSQELKNIMRTLAEDSPSLEQLQDAVNLQQQKMSDYLNLINQLNSANTQDKFNKLCDDIKRQSDETTEEPRTRCPNLRVSLPKSLLAEELLKNMSKESKSVEVSEAQLSNEETRKGCASVISCSESQNYSKPRVDTPSNTVDAPDASSLKRTSQPSQVNGYLNLPLDVENYGDKYPKHSISISPRGYAVQQGPQSTTKSVIVEPSSRSNSSPRSSPSSNLQQQQTHQSSPLQQRSYSSFNIDDLNGLPMPSLIPIGKGLRPTSYPSIASRESIQGARAPPNSPREALIATSVTTAWTEHHQHNPVVHSVVSTSSANTVTEVASSEQLKQREYRQDGGGDGRRPLDLAIKAAKRPNSGEESIEGDEERKIMKRASDVPSQWQPAYNQTNYKNHATPLPLEAYLSAQQHSPHQPQQQSANRLYPTYTPEASSFWSATDVQRFARQIITDQYGRTHSDYRHQMALVEQQRKQTVAFEYLYDKTVSGEKQPKQAISVMRTSQQAQQRRLTPTATAPATAKSDVPIKPTPQRASPATSTIETLDSHTNFSAMPVRSGSVVAHPERNMADQFTSLGTWAAEMTKNQGGNDATRKEAVERVAPSDSRPVYYLQPPSTSAVYKSPADLVQSGSNYTAGNGALPSQAARWTAPDTYHSQEQQARLLERASLGGPVHPHLQPRLHHQSPYYPAIPMSFNRAKKYAMDQLYQKPAHVLGYNPPIPYPYSPAMQAYPARFPPASLESVGPAQRLSDLVSLSVNASTNMMNPTAAARRYYAEANARLVHYPDYRARQASLDYAVDQPCTRLLNTYARNSIAKETTISRGVGRPYKNGATYSITMAPTSMNGSVAGSNSSTSSICSQSSVNSPRPSPLQQQSYLQNQPHLQPSTALPLRQRLQQASTSTSSISLKPYDRECPTPNLGQVNRSPNGLQSLRCSYCDKLGSQSMCLGCKAAYYCNTECQALHWQVHMTKCPIVMPRLKKVG